MYMSRVPKGMAYILTVSADYRKKSKLTILTSYINFKPLTISVAGNITINVSGIK